MAVLTGPKAQTSAAVHPGLPAAEQAVMELGATVCTVHQPPACAGCPIRHQCAAYAAVQAHTAADGDPTDAPSVMAYPGKVRCFPCTAAARSCLLGAALLHVHARLCMGCRQRILEAGGCF